MAGFFTEFNGNETLSALAIERAIRHNAQTMTILRDMAYPFLWCQRDLKKIPVTG
nr:hypothetical protein CKG001_21200 [Bdellovibrio sp. CKG001]